VATMPFSPCDPSQPTCTDVTVGILQHIFGPIVDVLVKGADPNTVSASSNLMATMFGFFNSGLLVVGSIIVSYVAVMGTVNTANDGEAMGKAWSSVWTPVRIVAGGAVLLPSTSGYSFIQTFVLMIALWGVGFANGIYKLGMSVGLMKPDGIVASSYQSGTYFGLRDFAKQYLAASYCARAANTIYADPAGTPMVMADSANPDKQVATGTRTDYTYYVKDRNATTALGGGEPICGTVTLTTYTTSGAYTDTSGTQAALDSLRATLMSEKLAAANSLMQDIDNWVATMPSDINQPGWDAVQSSQFNTLVKTREDQVAGNITGAMAGGQGAVDSGVTAFLTSLTNDGWSMAGGWYQRVGLLRSKLSTITNEPVGSVTQPSLSSLPSDARAALLTNSVTTVSESIAKKAEQSGNGYAASTTVKPEDIASLLPKDGTSDVNVGSLANDMGVKLSLLINGLMQSATDTAIGSSGSVDAISRMKTTGDLLASYRVILWSAQVTLETAMTATRVVVGAVGGVEVLGNRVDMSKVTDALWEWIMSVPVPILAKLAGYVGVLAFYFAVLLPSLPYTIFMVTVVGWILAVVQTVIAAPLWAIMHMRPSQTFVGSDAQGYLLLLALFVRPALAVIGLFGAMLIADPIVDYIAKAFFAMRGDVVTSTGLLGAVAEFYTFFWWFTAFGLVLLPVLYMIYGLPQVLPDHVLRWINAGVHDLGATGATAAMQSRVGGLAAEAGAEAAEALGGGRGGRSLGNAGGRGGPTPSPNGGGGRGRGGQLLSGPISANQQGVAPAVHELGTKHSNIGPGGTSNMARGGQGLGRTLGRRLSDGAGVALGRVVTDTASAVGNAMEGGRRGFARRVGSGLTGAVMSAGSEGVMSFQGGADARISAFREQMRARRSDAPAGIRGGAGATTASTPEAIRPRPPSDSGVNSQFNRKTSDSASKAGTPAAGTATAESQMKSDVAGSVGGAAAEVTHVTAPRQTAGGATPAIPPKESDG
jgi:conjugal transfer/type IV secretion protein DotA/TraY